MKLLPITTLLILFGFSNAFSENEMDILFLIQNSAMVTECNGIVLKTQDDVYNVLNNSKNNEIIKMVDDSKTNSLWAAIFGGIGGGLIGGSFGINLSNDIFGKPITNEAKIMSYSFIGGGIISIIIGAIFVYNADKQYFSAIEKYNSLN